MGALLYTMPVDLKALPRARFDALCYSRLPTTKFVSTEVEWWADSNENVLGVVVRDNFDNDWGYVILGRDERALFRAIENDVSLPTIEAARETLQRKLREYASGGEKVYPQGDEIRRKKNAIFRLVVPEDKLHLHFRKLAQERVFSPAREIIAEIAYSFEDPDGNYIQQFQTDGFNSRLWELYLYAFLHENDFFIHREFSAPDYLCDKFGEQVTIEAVTVNPTQSEGLTESSPEKQVTDGTLADYMAIKFGSALCSKLQKKYWEKEHVKGKPLIFAIADFHQEGSMVWSAPYLENYLYAFGVNWDQSLRTGKTVYSTIKAHTFGAKTIPSGFFFQPEAENVSAVIFNNSGTISKFNRMGRLAGFGDATIRMIRIGSRYNHETDSIIPMEFSVEIKAGTCSETWAEGTSIFHNPSARHPVDPDMFDGVGHHYFENERIVSYLPDWFPLSSRTVILLDEKK